MLALLLFTAGAAVGSFLNVCISRLPRQESLLYPASHCPLCGEKIKRLDIIPVLGFLICRARCRSCHRLISWRYPLVEVLMGLISLALFQAYGLSLEFLTAIVFCAFLFCIAIIDYEQGFIFNRVLLVLAATGILATILTGHLSLTDMLAGFFLGGIPLLLLYLLLPGSLGGGDVKFAAVLGLWLGSLPILLALWLAFCFGALGGICLLVTGRKSRRDLIAFGPFLSLGAAAAYFYAPQLLAVCRSLGQ